MLLDIDKANEKLQELAKIENVKIVYAIVSGSHLYGVDHAESDIDIRFVYKHPLTKVLGLKNYEENIVIQDGIYDFEGTELRKYLGSMSGNAQILLRSFVPDLFQIVFNSRLNSLAVRCITLKMLPFFENISPRTFGKHRTEGSKESYQKFTRNGELISFPKGFFYAYSYLINGYFLLKENATIFDFEMMRKEFEEITGYISPVMNIKEGQEFSFEEIMNDMTKIKDLIKRDMKKDLKKELTTKDLEEINHFLLDERLCINESVNS